MLGIRSGSRHTRSRREWNLHVIRQTDLDTDAEFLQAPDFPKYAAAVTSMRRPRRTRSSTPIAEETQQYKRDIRGKDEPKNTCERSATRLCITGIEVEPNKREHDVRGNEANAAAQSVFRFAMSDTATTTCSG
jgi:hypothetical protein